MSRRQTILVICVAMVVLAGCSGLIPSVEPPIDDDPNATVTTENETVQSEIPTKTTGAETSPTMMTTPTTTEAATRSYPPGYSASGITDPTLAATHHTRALLTHDSFTLTSNSTRGYAYDEDVWQSRNFSYRVDITDEQAYIIITSSDSSGSYMLSVSYYTKDTVYTRYIYDIQGMRPNLTYRVEPSSLTFSNLTATWRVHTLLSSVNYGSAEWVTRNGVTLIRYETSDVRDARDVSDLFGVNIGFGTDINPTVTAKFHSVVLVDQQGIIRNITFTIVHENGASSHVTYRIDGLDATTVEKPNWFDEAKANATNEAEREPRECEQASCKMRGLGTYTNQQQPVQNFRRIV